MDVDTALVCWVAFRSSLTQVADDLLEQGHLLPGQHRADQFRAFVGVPSLDGSVRFDFPAAVRAPTVLHREDFPLVQVSTWQGYIPGLTG